MKTIRLFATIREIAGTKTLTVPFQDGETVRDLIRSIAGIHPEIGAKLLGDDGQLSNLIHVYVSGRNVEWLNGLDTVIRESDEVLLVPPTAGG
ncbi:MAG: MoaD/ThiS family protein [Chloroflexi bacterium]|nr:MoaD/ThiS family protein [Chloroflexota bacterium]